MVLGGTEDGTGRGLGGKMLGATLEAIAIKIGGD